MQAWWKAAGSVLLTGRSGSASGPAAQVRSNQQRPKLDAIPAELLTLFDYQERARDYLDLPVWEWLEGGSGTLDALRSNRAAFTRHTIYNRLLVDCRHGTTRTEVLGTELAHPIALAPIGFQRMIHPEGEVATAKGAVDSLMVVSTFTSTPLWRIAESAAGPMWFQIYFQPQREQTLQLVRLAEKAGARALVVTLDTPVKPQGISAQKAEFRVPDTVQAVLVRGFEPKEPIHLRPDDSLVFRGIMTLAPKLEDLKWLRDQTKLPILAKGVSHPDDARLLLGAGCDGLFVSNHGGRALDCAPATLEAIGPIRAAVGPAIPIVFDGGVRTGGDVFKALALGANLVMIGRPQIHALAVAGSLGVAHMLKLLREEFEVVMALAGCPTIPEIGTSAIQSS